MYIYIAIYGPAIGGFVCCEVELRCLYLAIYISACLSIYPSIYLYLCISISIVCYVICYICILPSRWLSTAVYLSIDLLIIYLYLSIYMCDYVI